MRAECNDGTGKDKNSSQIDNDLDKVGRFKLNLCDKKLICRSPLTNYGRGKWSFTMQGCQQSSCFRHG